MTTQYTWTQQDIADLATKRTTFVDVLGPTPKKGTPDHAEHTRMRIRLKRAVEEHLAASAATPVALTATTTHLPGIAPAFSFGETGIVWPDTDLPLTDWQGLIHNLAQVKRQYHRYLADAIAYGRQLYGEATVQETLTQSEFVLDDLRRADVLMHLPDKIARTAALTPEQGYILSRELKDSPEDVYHQWAATAIEEGMSPTLLARCIQLGRVLTQADLDSQTGRGSGGIITIQHIVSQYQKWLNQVGGLPGVQKMSAADRNRLLQQHDIILKVVNLLE